MTLSTIKVTFELKVFVSIGARGQPHITFKVFVLSKLFLQKCFNICIQHP